MSEPAAITRKKTRQIRVGSVPVGGDAPVAVQSMTSTDTRDVEATVGQIRKLEEAGCEIIRVAVLDDDAVTAIKAIRKAIRIPLDRRYPFQPPTGHRRHGERRRCHPGQPGQPGTGEDPGSRRRGESLWRLHADRRELRVARERTAGKVRRTQPGSPRRERAGQRQPFWRISAFTNSSCRSNPPMCRP